MTQTSWLTQRERGTVLSLKFMIWCAFRIGRSATHLLIYPVCIYFILFAPKARKASTLYLARALNRTPTFIDTFKHFFCFGSVLLDRAYFLTGRFEKFDIKVFGEEIVQQKIKAQQGCILLSAHFGSFEALRTIGKYLQRHPIKILMNQENARNAEEMVGRLNPDIVKSIINIGKSGSLLQVQESIVRGDLVGILADRTIENDRVHDCQFLGQKTTFPIGPVLLANITKAPIILLFGLWRGNGKYEVHIELLSDNCNVARDNRLEFATQTVNKYVQRLEHYCRFAPYNWFNFYDFWNETATATATAAVTASGQVNK